MQMEQPTFNPNERTSDDETKVLRLHAKSELEPPKRKRVSSGWHVEFIYNLLASTEETSTIATISARRDAELR